MKTIVLTREMYLGRSVIVARHPYDKSIFLRLLKSKLGDYNHLLRGWILDDNQRSITALTDLFGNLVDIDDSRVKFNEVPGEESAVDKPSLPALAYSTEKQVLIFEEWMRQKRYSENSIRSYSECVRTFFRFLSNKRISEITNDDVVHFNQEYIIGNNLSTSLQNQVINGIKLFYRSGNHGLLQLDAIERPFNPQKLPVVLSLSEIEKLLTKTANLKHKTMLMTVYGCGLRRGELINLQIKDIDSARMMIHIHAGKGNKDRVIPLPDSLLVQLRKYVKAYGPKKYLFEGIEGGQYSPASIQQVFSHAVRRAGIIKKVTLHTLRHSYATHLLESGVNLRYIQDVLGHNSPKTTQIYTHVSTTELSKLPSPLDKLKI